VKFGSKCFTVFSYKTWQMHAKRRGKNNSCGTTLADYIKQNCLHYLPLYSCCKQPLNQRNKCETANALYTIVLFHHILWEATLCSCLDRIFWMATNFYCWTTKCVSIRGLYTLHLSTMPYYMCQFARRQFHPPPHSFQTNAFLLLQSTILRDLRTYLNGGNLLNELNQCPTPVNQEI